jgi:hypothetical protein
MIRDSVKPKAWLDQRIAYEDGALLRFIEEAKKPSGNPSYEPQFVYKISQKYLSLLLLKYSRGDDVANIYTEYPNIIKYWERSENLGQSVWNEQQQYSRHAWKVNLDHYITCFWLTGLALALEIPDDQWQRLVTLMGNEGEDALLDRVIASRQPGRRIGTELCHPKPYRRLLDAVLASPDKQPELLRSFVEHWYAELDRPSTKTMPAMYARPYWYKYHELEGGYFGYWCIEAVAAVKAFGMDDSLCLGHPNYPGDLLRPDGPTTHRVSEAAGKPDDARVVPSRKPSFLSRLFGR